jgi:hypothetical protein
MGAHVSITMPKKADGLGLVNCTILESLENDSNILFSIITPESFRERVYST